MAAWLLGIAFTTVAPMHKSHLQHGLPTEQREVTLLFADLRGFTELAASLEMIPVVCDIIGHIMDCLTDAVTRHDGYIVDYYGDGLFAMWNAPAPQANHAERACHAALEMLETLPTVVEHWDIAIQSKLRLGIGVHTGIVQVGNAGSTQHVKYGPRGPNANLAKRVESATKEISVPLVATATTIEQLSNRFTANRICRALLPGVREPIDLYAVRASNGDTGVTAQWASYDDALRFFEQAQLEEAAHALANLDSSNADVPVQFLVDQVERERGRQQRRRSTDPGAATSNGVIAISTK